MFKRHAIALMLATVMVTLLSTSLFSSRNDSATLVQGSETTAPTSTALESETSMSTTLKTDNGEDVNVEAMNSVGNYMVNVMNEENEKKARKEALNSQEKYSIITAEFDSESGVLYVGSTQPASCKIQARFLTDDDSKKETVRVEENIEKGKDIITALNVNKNALPEYYTIEIDLCIFSGKMKLCDTYVISDYTKNMQEIYDTTIEDFEPEYVVNLDQNETTNFVVLNENTVMADSTDTVNTLVSADYENGVYTFTNADETLADLKKDDYLYIQPNKNDMIAVIVGDVLIEDNAVTITKGDGDSGDMFDFIKVETTPGMSDDKLVFDQLEEGVTVADEQPEDGMMSEELTPIVGDPGDASFNFYNLGPLTYYPKINLSLEKDIGDATSLKGSVGISFGYAFNFYKKIGYISVDSGVNIKNTANVSAEISGEHEFPLAKAAIPILTVFNISFTPKLKIEAKASISVSFESEFYFGISYDTDSKKARPFSTQSSDTSISVGGSFFVGIVAEVAFGDITGDIVEIAFEPSVGFEVEGNLSPVSSIKANTDVIACDSPDGDTIHGCGLCIDGTISLKAEGTIELNLLSIFNKEPTFEFPLFEGKLELGDFYISDKGGFGWGDCPNILHKVTCRMSYVDEADGKTYPLKNTSITLGGVGNKTNDLGTAYFYCRSFYSGGKCLGKLYNYSSIGNAQGSVLIKDTATTVNLQLYKNINGGYTCSNNIKDTAPAVTTVTTKATTTKTTVATKYERQEQVAIESGELGKDRGVEGVKEHIYYILYNDGNMFIYGSGEMDSFSRSPFRNVDKIKEVSIENTSKGNITNIGQGVFQNCINLEKVIYPSSVTTINNNAFYNCPKLSTTPDLSNITSIGAYAFYGCESITELNIPNTISVINDYTFAGIGTKSIDLPKSIISIGNYAFANCKKLENIILPDANKEMKTSGIITIGNNAFANCTSLTELVIPNSVDSMGVNMLNGCTNLEKLTIPFASTLKKYADNGSNDTYSQVSDLFISTWPTACNEALKDYAIRTIKVTGGTHIPNSAFYQMSMLEEIIIPDSITNIDSYAFYQCANLKDMDIKDKVTEIGSHVFDGCTSFKVIPYGKNLKTTGDYTFANCTGLIGDKTAIEVPSTYTSIGAGAFSNCTNLQNINIPDTITFIGNNAFENCTSIKNLTIPKSVESMGTNMLNGCTNLEKLTIPFASTLKKYADNGNNDTYSQVSDLFISTWPTACNEALKDYAIKTIEVTGGTHIPNSAFYQMSMLEEVILHEPTTIIDSYAFYQCSSLKGMDIPDSITEIGSHVFDGCTSFKVIPYGKNLKIIGDYAFANCTSLIGDKTAIEVPSTYTSIGANAFENCTNLQNIHIPNTVISIGSSAFANCTSLTELVIPKSVESMGTNMLNGCTNIEKLTIPFASTLKKYAYNGGNDTYSQVSDLFISTWPTACNEALKDYAIKTIEVTGGTHIPDSAFYQMGILDKIILPASINNIDANAFYQCSGITEIDLPEAVVNIGNNAFKESGLKSITIPENCFTIGDSAFASCSGLKNISILNGVQTIKSNAFANCTSLKELVIPDSVEVMGTNMLNGCTNLEKLTIPFASTSKEYSYNGGSDGYSQVSDLFINTWTATCDEGLQNYAIKTIEVTGGTHIPNSAFYQMSTLEEVIIPETITNIDANAFYQCSNLKDMNIPDSVKEMGAHSFDGCASFNNVPYGKNLKVISDYAFANCTGLIGDETAIEISNTYTKIGAGAFSNCTNLQNINIPDTITFVGNNAFENCTSLTELVIPKSVESIGVNMLNGCTKIEKLTIPFASTSKEYAANGSNDGYSQVSDLFINTWTATCNEALKDYAIKTIEVTGGTHIPDSAFYQMGMLEEIIIPETITNIDANAFYQCSGITKINIPEAVVSIGNNAFKDSGSKSVAIPKNCFTIGTSAFENCTNLSDIAISNGVKKINSNAFANCTSLTELVIPDSVGTMGTNMLSGCTNLEKLTIPFASTAKEYSYSGGNDGYSQVSDLFINTWTATCNEALKDYSIKTIDVTGGTHIPDSAFYQMSTLKEVNIPETVTNIDNNAFYQCSGLEKITIRNRECNIYDNENTIAEDTVIYGYKNSTAQNYSDSYNRTFIPLDGEATTTTTTTTNVTTTTTTTETTTSTTANTNGTTTSKTSGKTTTSTTTTIHGTTTSKISGKTTTTSTTTNINGTTTSKTSGKTTTSTTTTIHGTTTSKTSGKTTTSTTTTIHGTTTSKTSGNTTTTITSTSNTTTTQTSSDTTSTATSTSNTTTTQTSSDTTTTMSSSATTTTTTGDATIVSSEIIATPSQSNFYLSVDDREFNAKDLFESIILSVTYEDGSNEMLDITNDVNFDGISPATLFEQREGTSDYDGVYKGTISPIYNGKMLNIESTIYVGIKGDADLNGKVNIPDAISILSYFSYNAASMEHYLIDDPDENYNKLAFFLSDVDTESQEGQNSDKGRISMDDAINVLTYFSQSSADIDPQWQVIIPSITQITGSVWEYMSNQ